jgi:hypothetical protein
VQLWWSDERTRQPVALARAPDGTLYVSDRSADPLGLERPTGCVFTIEVREGAALATRVLAAGAALVTPGALLYTSDGRLLLMDADANPRALRLPDGRQATPGVLYELPVRKGPDGAPAEPIALLAPDATTSPIALIERRPGELYLVDANADTAPATLGDGALFAIEGKLLRLVLDSASLGRPHALVDPAGGDVLADGRLILADANADPLGLGDDGTRKGVYGTGPGALVAIDPDAGTLETMLADARFVTPLAVRRVRP